MTEYTFRYRFKLTSRGSISADLDQLEMHTPLAPRPIELKSIDDDRTIGNSENLVLSSGGWSTETEAQEVGSFLADRLRVALVHHRLGAYPETSWAGGLVTNAGREWVQETFGVPHVLNDQYGLSVFASSPEARFVRVSAKGIRSVPAEALTKTFNRLCGEELQLSAKDLLAIDLFNTSFLSPNAAIRLLTLVIAVEALSEQELKSQVARDVLDEWLEELARADEISPDEKESLTSGMRFLQYRSIKGSARDLIASRISERTDLNMTANRFFSKCFDVRNALVHGALSSADEAEIGPLAANLELLVRDLLTRPVIGDA